MTEQLVCFQAFDERQRVDQLLCPARQIMAIEAIGKRTFQRGDVDGQALPVQLNNIASRNEALRQPEKPAREILRLECGGLGPRQRLHVGCVCIGASMQLQRGMIGDHRISSEA